MGSSMTFSDINDQTGFAEGEKFTTEADVRAYFTPAEQRAMFSEDALTDADLLTEMTETVIANRWHMTEGADHE